MMEFRRESEQCLLTHSRLLWVTLEGAAASCIQDAGTNERQTEKP